MTEHLDGATSQVVYAIGSPAHSLVKIGTTSNLQARQASLQTSSGFPLEVLWQQPGGHELEHFLHAEFAAQRQQGEWFDFGDAEPADTIAACAARYRPSTSRTKASVEIDTARNRIPGDSEFGRLLARLEATGDPATRGALATEALEMVKDFNAVVSALRQAAARELKDQGLSYREIGERFGRDGKPLHFTRIQQILKGGPTGRWAKAAREAEAKKITEGE